MVEQILTRMMDLQGYCMEKVELGEDGLHLRLPQGEAGIRLSAVRGSGVCDAQPLGGGVAGVPEIAKPPVANPTRRASMDHQTRRGGTPTRPKSGREDLLSAGRVNDGNRECGTGGE